jgi:hypothetical protein
MPNYNTVRWKVVQMNQIVIEYRKSLGINVGSEVTENYGTNAV